MNFFLPLLSSILYILSFPFNLSGHFAFIALMPLIIISRLSEKKNSLFSGTIFGFVISIYYSLPLYHSMTLNQDSSDLLPALLILITVILPYSLIYGLFSIICRWSSEESIFFKLLIPPAFWILLDYMRELSSFFIPWGLAGYSQIYSPFIQIADTTGIHGVTFIIILSNTIIAEIVIILIKLHKRKTNILLNTSANFKNLKPGYQKTLFFYFILLSTILILTATYGIIKKRLVTEIEHNSDKINYLIVQGNSDSVERWDEASSISRYQTYASLTVREIKNSDLIIWPETVLNSSDKINFEIMSEISSLLKDKSYFITGGIRKDKKGNTFNSIFVMKKNGLEYIYDKKLLFPYSERPFFGKTAGSFLNSPEKFSAGTSNSIYQIGEILTGFNICFESIYPSVIRKQAKSGASLIVNVANDSWFGDSSIPHLQKYNLIARAIENRIGIIRSANSGISFAVSPSGNIISEIPFNSRNISKSELPVIKGHSFYSISGNLIIILSIFILLYKLLRDEIKKNKTNIN